MNKNINNGKISLLSILQERRETVQSLLEKKMLSEEEITALEKFGILEDLGILKKKEVV